MYIIICHSLCTMMMSPKHSNIETIGTPPTSKPYFIEACRGYSDSPDLGPLRDAMELLCWLFLRFFLPLPGAMWQPVLLSLVAHLVIWCLLHWIEYLVCTWSEQHSMSDCWKTRKLGAWPIFLLPRPRHIVTYYVYHCDILWPLRCHKSSTKTKWILNSIHQVYCHTSHTTHRHHNTNTLHDHNGHHHNP